MHTESNDRTPVWRTGMGDVEGMAAHPSMQRNSTPALTAKLREARDVRADAAEDLAPSDEKDTLLASMDRRIEAIKLALTWREGRDG